LGLEPTPDEFVASMVQVFREVRRVLRDDGVCFMNLGDSYASSGSSGKQEGLIAYAQNVRGRIDNGPKEFERVHGRAPTPENLKPKDLIGIPWRVALALQAPYVVPTCVEHEIDRAWLAAMFDGEGCIGIRKFDSYRKEKQQVYQDGFVVYTVVTNNDQCLLERCVDLTGLGSMRLKQRAASTDGRGIVSRRDSFGWRLDGNGAVDVIRAIYPYLVAKRKQACIAYTLDTLNKSKHRSRLGTPEDIQAKKVRLKELINQCNQREPIDLPEWIEEPTQEVQPGWYLRSDIIWAKPNPMPESVTDRPTKSHEYVFLLTKSERYFWDAEAVREGGSGRNWAAAGGNLMGSGVHKRNDGFFDNGDGRNREDATGRNIRTVWTIPTESFPGSHFATFPRKLVEPCIKAGTSQKGRCPECGKPWVREVEKTFESLNSTRPNMTGQENMQGWKGTTNVYTHAKTTGWRPTCNHNHDPVPCIVLDPFAGSGTTGVVAEALGRQFIGLDLSADYLRMAKQRIERPHKHVPRPGRTENHPLFHNLD
ncbi:MAG: site-specific DNA-methyltransferase, partial [Candidatus Sulfotelmatobacter sp.]